MCSSNKRRGAPDPGPGRPGTNDKRRGGPRAAARLLSIRAAIAIAAAVAVGGCDTLTSWSQKLGLSDDDSRPVGIGTKTDEFRKSPCACFELELAPADDGYRARLRARLGA